MIKRIADHVLLDAAKEAYDEATIEQAIQHYVESVPGAWRLISVLRDGHYREFYWSRP